MTQRVLVWLLQLWCALKHGHQWAREVDLHRQIGPWRSTAVQICDRCGRARLVFRFIPIIE